MAIGLEEGIRSQEHSPMLEGHLRNEECTQLLQRIRVRFPETAAGSSLPPVIPAPRGCKMHWDKGGTDLVGVVNR